MLGGYRWQSEGKQPVIFTIVVVLFMANTFLYLVLDFFAKNLIPQGIPGSQDCAAMSSYDVYYVYYKVPKLMCWDANWGGMIGAVLFGLAAMIMFALRKNVVRVR
jgi:hypothetical protein